MVCAEGSNVSDGASLCTDHSVAAHSEAKHDRVNHTTPGHGNRGGGSAPISHDDNNTLTETESIISSRQGHHQHHLHKSSRHHSEKYEKYNKYNGTLCVFFSHLSKNMFHHHVYTFPQDFV